MQKIWYHILGIAVIAVWGMTFISSKILLRNGMTPSEIFFIRFAIAYLGILVFEFVGDRRKGNKTRLFSSSFKDELLLVILGVTGGSLYFICENAALEYTQASNVSFIVCCAPLPTVFLTKFCKRFFHGEYMEKLESFRVGPLLVVGTLLAIFGLGMIVFNGTKLHLSPIGDLLALGGCLCWAVYSIFMGALTEKYGTVFATRKVFFYGLLTVIPFLFWNGAPYSDLSILARPAVLWNLLFLAVVASLVCYVAWNEVMAQLGNVTSTNYVYLNPVFTLIGSTLILHEQLTWLGALGSAFILAGVILAGRNK